MSEKQESGNSGPAKGRDFFVEMAKNPRSRVIMANTADTYMMADITRQGDIIISRLRDALMRTLDIDEFSKDMEEYYKIIFSLEDHLEHMGEKVGIKYRKSRTYKSVIDKHEVDTLENPPQTAT
jgi:hypothetical protein